MATSALQILYLISLNVINWGLSTILPIYNKEVFQIAPYPLFMTLVQMMLVVPLALFESWVKLDFPCSLSWMKPPSESTALTIFSSLAYGIMMASGNFSIFVSGVDFATLFRSSGIIWQALFAFVFLREQITLITVISISFVLSGILTLTLKFEWSTSQMPSVVQCSIQTFSMIFSSLASVFMKKVLINLKNSQRNYPMLVVLSWRYAIACIPIFIASLYMEPGAWINYKNIFSQKVILYITLGAFVSQLFQLSNLWLADLLSVIANNITGQFKFVPILIVSHYLYQETQWTVRQVIGAVLLTCGAVLYSTTKLFKKDEKEEQNQINAQNEQISEILNNVEDDAEEDRHQDIQLKVSENVEEIKE